MARKRDYAAEYARRRERARAQGYTGYRSKRAATSSAPSSSSAYLMTRKGGGRFMTVDADTGGRAWAVAQQSQKRRGWPSVDVELETGEWRHVGRVDLRLFPTPQSFLDSLGVWITSNDYLDDTDNGRGVAAESATLDWGKSSSNQGSALRPAP